MRHTEDHDVWGPDDRCDVLIMEDDGTVTRCGYVRSVVAFDLRPDMPKPPAPRAPKMARNVIIGVVVVVLGLLIALDWLAFWLYVFRNDDNPNLAVAFIFRIAASGAYAAAAVWLWRRR
ncbi:hypothetical protein [Demequina sp.]|uniref:hypothetical protein n=1 Tax=Demequina sp. TaxID=2050685 RepID=UPI003D10429B